MAANDTTILAPDGRVATLPTTILEPFEAELLRQYKKFLERHGLQEALYCRACWNGERADGCKAFVTSTQISIQCRCRHRFFQGQAY